MVSPSPLQYIVGTSGYSFADWVGEFYPPGMSRRVMFTHYVQHFRTVELNFTYYRMPVARTLERMAEISPEGFLFWVKANQETTHKGNRAVAGEFLDNLHPLAGRGKLAGVLLQFPQSFRRTIESRRYLAAALEDLSTAPWGRCPLAVEFRHSSWQAPATLEGLRARQATLVVPDVPAIAELYHSPPAATTETGYLRLHSREAGKWYAGEAARYDYSYSDEELRTLARQWSEGQTGISRLFAFFNNCHRAQAARNAEAFQRIVSGL